MRVRLTYRGLAWETLIQKASVVCPDSVRPDMSTIVPLITTGMLTLYSSKNTSMAKSAAWDARDRTKISKRSPLNSTHQHSQVHVDPCATYDLQTCSMQMLNK